MKYSDIVNEYGVVPPGTEFSIATDVAVGSLVAMLKPLLDKCDLDALPVAQYAVEQQVAVILGGYRLTRQVKERKAKREISA